MKHTSAGLKGIEQTGLVIPNAILECETSIAIKGKQLIVFMELENSSSYSSFDF